MPITFCSALVSRLSHWESWGSRRRNVVQYEDRQIFFGLYDDSGINFVERLRWFFIFGFAHGGKIFGVFQLECSRPRNPILNVHQVRMTVYLSRLDLFTWPIGSPETQCQNQSSQEMHHQIEKKRHIWFCLAQCWRGLQVLYQLEDYTQANGPANLLFFLEFGFPFCNNGWFHITNFFYQLFAQYREHFCTPDNYLQF